MSHHQNQKQRQRLSKQQQKQKQKEKDKQKQKQNKYNYLQHSFQKQLQRSYDRNNIANDSPSSSNRYNYNCQNINPNVSSPPARRSPNQNHNGWGNKQKSAARSSEFSPYQNKQQNVRDKILVQQLKNHNKVLNQQLNQYKNMVDKLHVQLRIRSQELGNIDALRQREKLIHQETVAQMRQQIGILLTKNTYLQQKNIVLDRQIRKYQAQLSKNEVRTRSLSAVAASSKQTSSKLIQQISSVLSSTIWNKSKKRDNGKLMNQTFSNVNSTLHSPKISDKLTNLSESTIIQQIQSMAKKLQKYEQLTQSITEMHHKITGKKILSDNTDRHGLSSSQLRLKTIWKWLKELGHNYNITHKWKKMLIQVLGTFRNQKVQDITIDQVLQKTVVKLHSQ